MPALADTVSGIVDRLSKMLDVFDLSYFVEGCVALAVLPFWYEGVRESLLNANAQQAVGVLIGCYAAGLICFATGRRLRRMLSPLFPGSLGSISYGQYIPGLLRIHGIDSDPLVAHYRAACQDDCTGQKRENAMRRLYVRMWSEIRQRADLKDSYAFLNNSWIKAATHDGLASALVIWAVTFGMAACGQLKGGSWHLSSAAYAVVAALLLAAAYACVVEGARAFANQVEELVAVYACSVGSCRPARKRQIAVRQCSGPACPLIRYMGPGGGGHM